MIVETTLSNKMRKLVADRGEEDLPDGFARAAENFDKATNGYFANPQTVNAPSFIAAYAKARRLWCEATGESLI